MLNLDFDFYRNFVSPSSVEGLKLDFYRNWFVRLDVLFYCLFQWRWELEEDETMRERKKRKKK
jgi:hypothetical protein